MDKTMQKQMNQVFEFTKTIAKAVEIITEYKVKCSFQGGKRIMRFYIFKDIKNNTSKTEYRQFVIEYQNDVSAETYVEYIIKNVDNEQVYFTGKICENVIIIKEFLENQVFSKFVINTIDGTLYYGNEDIFQVNDCCSIKTSMGKGTMYIEENGYYRTFIDLKKGIHFTEKVS